MYGIRRCVLHDVRRTLLARGAGAYLMKIWSAAKIKYHTPTQK